MTTTRITTLLLLITIILSMNLGGVSAQEKLNVVTTTTQAIDLVHILAGDLVNVTGLMGAGVDPHLYQPKESDIRAMNEADAVFYSGLHLEGQFDEVFEALGERNILTYAVSDPVRQAGFVIDSFGGQQGTPDPHFWFDPRNWQLVAGGMAQVLGELDPENAEIYEANAASYIQELDLLYNWAVEAMQQVPAEQRVLVTSHDAFQYFGDVLGWQVRGLQGISTQDEAGVGDIQAIAQFVAENQIPVMFIESSVPPDAIEAVQESVKAQGFDVGIGVRELFSDAMGEPGAFGGTYIGMFAQNVITILQSFGYDIPAFPDGLNLEIPAELLEV